MNLPEGFTKEGLALVAESLEKEPKTVNVGGNSGLGDYHLETLEACAARFIRAALASAPTPPAPEVEPVYQARPKIAFSRWEECSQSVYEKREGSSEWERRILYTHPADDGLRKAAEEACKFCEGYALAMEQMGSALPTHEGSLKAIAVNLRAELEKKS